MANAKRQRQDEARILKRQAEELAVKKRAVRNRFRRIGAIGGAALLVIVALLVLTRGNGDGEGAAVAEGPTTTAQVTLITASPQLSKPPVVSVPSTPAPEGLEVKDLVTGTGDTVQVGDTVTVQYTGVVYATKAQFDSSWDRNSPFAVDQVGTSDAGVIEGWSKGLVGARVGSRRQLIIPPALGYGTDGNAKAGIKGTDTLLFVVDIISTARGAGSPGTTASTASTTTSAVSAAATTSVP